MPDQQRPSPFPDPWSPSTSRPADETQQLPVVTGRPPYWAATYDLPARGHTAVEDSPRSVAVPVLALTLVCFVVAAGVFAFLALSASSRLDRTRLDLSAAQEQTGSVERELVRVRRDLAAAQTAVATERRRADAAEGDLTAAQQASAAQQQLIADMRVCLDGVLVSMQALSQNDPARAQAELQRVQPSCDRAYQQAEGLDA